MKFHSVILASVLSGMAYSHATITSVLVNDVSQEHVAPVHGLESKVTKADGYIRTPNLNSPVKDVTSKDMTCNTVNNAAPLGITLSAGDKMTMQWHHDYNTAQDDIIDGSHKGPIMTYIAPAASNGAGPVWVKIAEDGYDKTAKKWAVTKLIEKKGLWDVVLPPTLAKGDYLLRQELIANHESDTKWSVNNKRGAQLYMECIQITVATGGASTLPAGVPFPGGYKEDDLVFNQNNGDPTKYKIPGPAVWAQAAKPGAAVAATGSKASVGPWPATAGAKREVFSAKFRSIRSKALTV